MPHTGPRRCSQTPTATCCSGIAHADSVVWDAHKMMRAASVCAAILVRDARRLDAAFQQKASYLIYEEAETAGPDLLGRQVECTKAPLGLKIFLNLAFRGERGLGEYVERPVRQDPALLGGHLRARGLRVPVPAREQHPLLSLRQRFGAPGRAARAAARRGPLPSELDRGSRRALAAPGRDGPGDGRVDDRGAARRDRALGGRLAGAKGRLDQAARESQRHRVQAPGAVAGKVAAGLAARSDPELGRRQAEQLELTVV